MQSPETGVRIDRGLRSCCGPPRILRTLRTRSNEMGDPHYYATMPSPVGELTLVASDHGLRAILWPDDDDRVPLPDAMLEQQDRPVLTDAI